MIAGVPEEFAEYVRSESIHWEIRKDKLVPPADPFKLIDELAALPGYDEEMERDARDTVARAVRTVVRPAKPSTYGSGPHPKEGFKQLRRAFLDLKPRWDATRSMYVRFDGSYDVDVIKNFNSFFYKFSEIPGVSIEAELRRSDVSSVDLSVLSQGDGKRIKEARLQLRNASGSTIITEPSLISGGTVGIGFQLKENTPLRMELRWQGKTFSSPIFRL